MKQELNKLKALISQKKDRIAHLKNAYRGLFHVSKKGISGNPNTKMMRQTVKDQESSLRKLQEKFMRLKSA